MAVTHPQDATRNAMADLVVDLLDVNTPPAKLVFQTAGSVTVATLTFGNPAFGASGAAPNATPGRANANAITSDTNAAGNASPITKAELRQGAGTSIINCSVTATGGGGDITMNSVTVTAGQTVAITSLTYAAAP